MSEHLAFLILYLVAAVFTWFSLCTVFEDGAVFISAAFGIGSAFIIPTIMGWH